MPKKRRFAPLFQAAFFAAGRRFGGSGGCSLAA
jgi:hypothetical protein